MVRAWPDAPENADDLAGFADIQPNLALLADVAERAYCVINSFRVAIALHHESDHCVPPCIFVRVYSNIEEGLCQVSILEILN